MKFIQGMAYWEEENLKWKVPPYVILLPWHLTILISCTFRPVAINFALLCCHRLQIQILVLDNKNLMISFIIWFRFLIGSKCTCIQLNKSRSRKWAVSSKKKGTQIYSTVMNQGEKWPNKRRKIVIEMLILWQSPGNYEINVKNCLYTYFVSTESLILI